MSTQQAAQRASSSSSSFSSSGDSFQFSPWHGEEQQQQQEMQVSMSAAEDLFSKSGRILPLFCSPSHEQERDQPKSKNRVYSPEQHDVDADDEGGDYCYTCSPMEEEDEPNSDAKSLSLRRSQQEIWTEDDLIKVSETSSEDLFSSDAESSNKQQLKRKKLGELLNLKMSPNSEEQEALLGHLQNRHHHRNQQLPPKKRFPTSRSSPKFKESLLVQALCGGRKSTSAVPSALGSSASSPTRSNASQSSGALKGLSPVHPAAAFNSAVSPNLQRTNASRRRCNAPSPLRSYSTNSRTVVACSSASSAKNQSVSIITRSRSSGGGTLPLPLPLLPAASAANPPLNYLTKSKSTGAAAASYVVNQNHGAPRTSVGSRKSGSNTTTAYQRWPSTSNSSGRRSSFSCSSSSINSSSNDSILNAMDRYQQHKNIKVEQQRRSSYLPYKSALLSFFFFPLPSFWSPNRHSSSTHLRHHSNATATAAYF